MLSEVFQTQKDKSQIFFIFDSYLGIFTCEYITQNNYRHEGSKRGYEGWM